MGHRGGAAFVPKRIAITSAARREFPRRHIAFAWRYVSGFGFVIVAVSFLTY
jgi:hypothetical protein